jgi:hypothetical protein
MLSLYLCLNLAVSAEQKVLKNLPFVVDSLDDKPEGRADTVHILSHDPLYDGCLSCIVEAAMEVSPTQV